MPQPQGLEHRHLGQWPRLGRSDESNIVQRNAVELMCDDRMHLALQAAWQQTHSELFCKLDSWLDRQQCLVDGLLRNVGEVESERHVRALKAPERLPEQPEPLDPAEPPELFAIKHIETESSLPEIQPQTTTKASCDSLGVNKTRTSLRYERSSSYLDAVAVSHGLTSPGHRKSSTGSVSDVSVRSILKHAARKITLAWQFDVFFATVVLLNAVLIGVEVDQAATNAKATDLAAFSTAQNLFALLFFLELMIRMQAEGFVIFCTCYWNIFDSLLVSASLLEFALTFSASSTARDALGSSSNLRIIRIVRITRLVKVVRIMRVARFVSALRKLVFSILMTMRSLLWSMLLLASILFTFGVLFTDITTTHLNEIPGPWEPTSAEAILHRYFHSLSRSMLSLYACILGGVSWDILADAIESTGWFYRMVFDAYISFCSLAFLNVVTGVFCHSAIESAQRDHDMLVNSMIQNKDFFLTGLQKLFLSIDDDGSGAITITEFEAHFDDLEVRNLFEALGLDAADAWSLFVALDADNDRTLTAEEFLEGCLYLRGAASAIDLAHIEKELMKMKAIIIEQSEQKTNTYFHSSDAIRLLNDSKELQTMTALVIEQSEQKTDT
eukprot:TRINITY_DN24735_c0_g1_i1.p1 TRINITY_DN24735_c0_g1~~TRINITY_DN24735_c0_g1_i1.p1  ORF type:complete len:632 (-),score=105.98 TRINITY_DN24735_c0_g1_i1:97-1935(-)